MKLSKNLIRFGVTMEPDLLERLDNWVANQAGYSRSRAIRNIVREKLVSEEWELGEAATAAAINLLYDHHTRETTDSLINIQHKFLDIIVGTMHVHLDAHLCFEVIILRGIGNRIRELAIELKKIRSVLHCTITPAATGVGYHKTHRHK